MGKDVISKILPYKFCKIKYTDAIEMFINSFNSQSNIEFSLVDKQNGARIGFINNENCSVDDACLFLDLLKTCNYYFCITEPIKIREFESMMMQLVKTTLYDIECEDNEIS